MSEDAWHELLPAALALVSLLLLAGVLAIAGVFRRVTDSGPEFLPQRAGAAGSADGAADVDDLAA